MTQSLNTVADSFLDSGELGSSLPGVGESYGFFLESVDIDSFREVENECSKVSS